MRLMNSTDGAEIRMGWHDYYTVTIEIIDACCMLIQAADGTMELTLYTTLPNEACGFYASAIRKNAEDMHWLDK